MLLPEAIIIEKLNNELAWALVKFLIERDVSSENTGSTSLSDGESLGKPHQADMSTLMLAAKSGNAEIVEEILRRFPHAVENIIDSQGRNFLHVAIQHHHIRILDIVKKTEFPMTRLVRKLDKDGNSILHMVGIEAADDKPEGMHTPALLLQENLLLFERVNEISNRELIWFHNEAKKTARELFAENNAKLHQNATEWLKSTAENCSIVSVLIATVAFAAAFTVPGGPNQDTGYPILNERLFIVFSMADVISLTSALTSVILFLLILTSPFQLKKFKQCLPTTLMAGVLLLIFSISAMTLAFVAAVILQIRSNDQGMEIALYSVIFFLAPIFMLSFPFYASLMKSFGYSLNQ
ncbi:hypothetical protein RJ640_005695 [Escallonia rubra]|uniref:PGG domain-containing protein n=1 Tax=Escallonia rubra TaxID=112253 RepID=A0AA88RLN7_9ASTE|nr:hypothetical protein RJ640_005695 [Escallonia rubra]